MQNLQTFIQQHEPTDNTSVRLNCPLCAGRNTFTLRNNMANFYGIVTRHLVKQKEVKILLEQKQILKILLLLATITLFSSIIQNILSKFTITHKQWHI